MPPRYKGGGEEEVLSLVKDAAGFSVLCQMTSNTLSNGTFEPWLLK